MWAFDLRSELRHAYAGSGGALSHRLSFSGTFSDFVVGPSKLCSPSLCLAATLAVIVAQGDLQTLLDPCCDRSLFLRSQITQLCSLSTCWWWRWRRRLSTTRFLPLPAGSRVRRSCRLHLFDVSLSFCRLSAGVCGMCARRCSPPLSSVTLRLLFLSRARRFRPRPSGHTEAFLGLTERCETHPVMELLAVCAASSPAAADVPRPLQRAHTAA